MQTIDMSADFLTWDNCSQVRYEVGRRLAPTVDAPPVFDGMTPAPKVTTPSKNRGQFVPTAKRRNLTGRELAASGGAYSGLDQKWLLPAALLPGVVCKPGDVVVELDDADARIDATRWTVLEVDRRKNRQTWALTCRDLVLANDLGDVIGVERPLLSYDAAGVPTKSFPSDPGGQGLTIYKNLRCRVQLVEKAIEDERGIRGLAGKYEIYLPYDIDVSAEDRVLFADGQYGDITGYKNAERIDMLPVLLVTRKV